MQKKYLLKEIVWFFSLSDIDKYLMIKNNIKTLGLVKQGFIRLLENNVLANLYLGLLLLLTI